MCSRNLGYCQSLRDVAMLQRYLLPDTGENTAHTGTNSDDLHGPVVVDSEVTELKWLRFYGLRSNVACAVWYIAGLRSDLAENFAQTI